MSKIRPRAWFWPLAFILVISLWRLAIAAVMPVTQDEAYYFDWAGTLSWGYFDHPPGVALLGTGTRLLPESTLAARLGTWLAGTVTLLLLWRLFWRCGLRDQDLSPGALTIAVILTAASLPGFLSGFLATPDTALALCWALALHEALAALEGKRWRWLSTGIAVGLGLLGKYTMLLMGPVLLSAIVLADPRALRTRWPYLGALAALLVFSPNLWWNAQNDWLSLRFQFGHGFSTDTGTLHLAADALPAAQPPASVSSVPEPEETPEEPMALGDRLASIAAFAASQLAFFGFLLIPLAAALFALFRRRDQAEPRPPPGISAPASALLASAALLPLGLFALIAAFSEVEPNWSAMFLPAAGALFAAFLPLKPPWIITAGLGNLLVLSLYALHAATAALPLGDEQNRILRETHGFAELGSRVAELPGPVFADRYQYTAMLNFYQQTHRVAQWPGITRPSEYSRGVIAPLPRLTELQKTGFWLVSSKPRPPGIPGFSVAEAQPLFDCPGTALIPYPKKDPNALPPCPAPLHVWQIIHYRPSDAGR